MTVRLPERERFQCAPLTGCGSQHPLRALSGTRVLLAAAPTTPPCFRHWRRSSSLLRINSGKIIFNRAMPERLRTLRHCIFTRGGVEENGSCRAAFCESAARQGKIFADFQRAELPHSKPDGFDSSLPEGAFGMARKFPTKAQSLRVGTLPLGSCRAATEGL